MSNNRFDKNNNFNFEDDFRILRKSKQIESPLDLEEKEAVLLEDNKTHLKKRSMFSKVMGSTESGEYLDVITKGFIWVIMVFISIFALILVFRSTNYEEEEINKDIIIAQNQNLKQDYSELNQGKEQEYEFIKNQTNNTIDSNSKKTAEPEKESSAISSKSKNKLPVITQGKDSLQKNLTKKYEETKKINKDKSLTTLMAKQTIPNTQASKTKTLTSKALPPKAVTKKENILPAKKTVASPNKAFLVNIFSSDTKAKVEEKWKIIEKSKPELFISHKVYITQTIVPNKGIFYRLGLGYRDEETLNMPSYPTKEEAAKYCSYLKNNQLDCFVVEITKNELSKLNAKKG